MKPVIVDAKGMVKKMEWGKPIYEDCDVQFDIKIKDKNRIVSYLKSFEPAWYTSQSIIDMVKNQRVSKADHWYTDGEYDWSESDIYHFENYDMQLNAEFVKYVLTKETIG